MAEEEKFQFPDEKPSGATGEPESDVKIEIVDDTPEADRKFQPGASKGVAEVSDEELSAYSSNVQARIKELSFARHDERRAKEQALRERQELEKLASSAIEENRRLKQYVQSGEKVFAGTAKAAAQAKLDIAKRKFKEAHEAFDSDALVAAQQELTAAQMEMSAAENFRPMDLQNDSGRDTQSTTEQAPVDERAVKWQEKNRWFGSDDEMTALALVTHKRLVNSGVDPRTDDYYKAIDASIRKRFPDKFEDATPPDSPAPRRVQTVVASTTRSSGPKHVRLTPTQVALAKKFGLSIEEYAKHVAALETTNG